MNSQAARLPNELVISLVRHEPVLWDQRSVMYRNADARADAWKRLVRTLGLAVTDENVKLVSNRWRNLRDTFAKKLRELKKKSGAGVSDAIPKWKFFDHLLFLKDVTEPRPTSSNLDDDSSDATQDAAMVFASMLPPRCASAASESNYCSDTPDYTIPASPSPTLDNHTDFSFQPISTQPVPTLLTQPSTSTPVPPTPSTPVPLSSITQRTTQTKKTNKRKQQAASLLDKIDKELKDEKENRTEQFLLSLAEHMDKVPEHLRGQCKMHLLEVLLHYEVGEVPTMLSVIRGPPARSGEH